MYTIRRATQADKGAIRRVHFGAIVGTCAGHYTPEVIRLWAGRLRPEKYAEAIDANEFFVAEEDGEVVGFAELDPAAAELTGLYVSPAAGRRGVGRELLRTLEERARAFGLESLSLTSSLNAVAFYERAGFEPLARLSTTLGPGVERASVRMSKRLPRPDAPA